MENKKMLYDVNERPPIAKWIILALQHVFAMFGATILVPILVNSAAGEEVLTIPVALVTSGIGTLIYIICTKGKSPVYLGSSFAFIAPIAAAFVKGGISGAMTGVMLVGLIYVVFAILIALIGKKWIDKLLPPVVIGPMIMIIGLGLAPSAVSQIGLNAEVLEWKPDLIVTCAYGQIIPEELLNYPKYGCINVHASLLPKLRGGAPIHKSIIDDYGKTGITIMYMDKQMDTGDIISQKETVIDESDDLETLSNRLSKIGTELILETIPKILSGENDRIKQNNEEATYAYNIKREEEHIDFNKSSREIFNLVRGLYPVPGANTIIDDQEMKVYKVRITDRVFMEKKNGEITQIYKDGIGISTKDGEIVLLDIKPFGKRRMLARDFLNGINKEELIGKVLR